MEINYDSLVVIGVSILLLALSKGNIYRWISFVIGLLGFGMLISALLMEPGEVQVTAEARTGFPVFMDKYLKGATALGFIIFSILVYRHDMKNQKKLAEPVDGADGTR